MQRRYLIIASVALAALVLVPVAALALGPGGGSCHRGDGPGPKNLSAIAPGWAGNGTAPDRGAQNLTAPGACAGNGTHLRDCTGSRNLTGTADHRVGQRDRAGRGNTTWTAPADQARVRDPDTGPNRTGAPPAFPARAHRGECR